MKSYKEIMNDINTFVLDVDGVLTDGMVHVTQEGEILRNMNVRDGFVIKAAIESGYNVCVISGGKNEGVRLRLRTLGVTDIYMGIADKVEVFEEYIETFQINPKQVLYMGDDIPDYQVMKLVGLPTCPQNAVAEIKSISKYISHVNGGNGGVNSSMNGGGGLLCVVCRIRCVRRHG